MEDASNGEGKNEYYNEVISFEEFKALEGSTDSYDPPKHAVLPYPGDTGYEYTRKKYRRFLWTIPSLGKKGSIDPGPNAPKINEDNGKWGYIDMGEISGMGNSDGLPSGDIPGYKNRSQDPAKTIPTDMYEDPDKKKKRTKRMLNNIKTYSDFNESESEKIEIVSMETPVPDSRANRGVTDIVKDPKEIEEYLTDEDSWTDDELFTTKSGEVLNIDDLIGKTIIVGNKQIKL